VLASGLPPQILAISQELPDDCGGSNRVFWLQDCIDPQKGRKRNAETAHIGGLHSAYQYCAAAELKS